MTLTIIAPTTSAPFHHNSTTANRNNKNQKDDGSLLTTAENKIRFHVFICRIRLTEFFKQFDRLHTNTITENQFRRCLREIMEKETVDPLHENEANEVIKQYGIGNGMVNWRKFVDSIDSVFGSKSLDKTPTKDNPSPYESIIKVRKKLSEEDESKVIVLTEKLKHYVKQTGFDVKGWFRDFDKNHNGFITRSQFGRGVPPNLLTKEDQDLLIKKYISKTGNVNYFKLNAAVNRKSKRTSERDRAQLIAKDNHHDPCPIGTEELLLTPQHRDGNDLEYTLSKVKEYVKVHGIHISPFIRGYDKHNKGRVTVQQFKSGVLSTGIPLSDDELGDLVKKYACNTPGTLSTGNNTTNTVNGSNYTSNIVNNNSNNSNLDSMLADLNLVDYRKFCYEMEEGFDDAIAAGDQLESSGRNETLMKQNELSSEEEEQCQKILQRIRKIVHDRRFLMLPYFHDYDKRIGNVGRVTRSHFCRIMSTLNIPITEDEYYLLFQRYQDKEEGRIVYRKFIQEVERNLDAQEQQEQQKEEELKNQLQTRPPVYVSTQSFPDLMNQFSRIVKNNMIRVSDCFVKFMKLGESSIPKNDFIRGLSTICNGLSLSQYTLIADEYLDPQNPSLCQWKKFAADVSPSPSSPAKNKATMVLHLSSMTASEQNKVQEICKKIKNRLNRQRVYLKPAFRDFDKLYLGTVTPHHFHQCLSYGKIEVDPHDVQFLCKAFSEPGSPQRVYYMPFLNQLDDIYIEDTYSIVNKKLPQLSLTPKQVYQENQHGEQIYLENVLERIRKKVKTERIRLSDNMKDFDKLRHGHVSNADFQRALTIYFPFLKENAFQILISHFQNTSYKNRVDYIRFNKEVDHDDEE